IIPAVLAPGFQRPHDELPLRFFFGDDESDLGDIGDRLADGSPVKAENHIGVRRNQKRRLVVGIIQRSSAGPIKTFKAGGSTIRDEVGFRGSTNVLLIIAAECDTLWPRLSWNVNAGLIAFDVGPVEFSILHALHMGGKADTGVVHDGRYSRTDF